MNFKSLAAAAALIGTASLSHAALVVNASTNASALANAIGGSGITISNATLGVASNTAAGTFTGGASSVGFDNGVVLTTGTVSCVPGPNDSSNCGLNNGTTTSLKFDFVSSTGKLFFQYVFGSEEYNEYVGTQYNDQFELRLNGNNIALLPGAGGVVSINNVNCGSNAAYYRNNSTPSTNACPNLNLDIQYDGLTTVLTAEADVTAGNTNNFEFIVYDRGDANYDSGVFIKQGSFSGTNPVPLPGTLALLGAGLFALGTVRRRQANGQ